MNKDTPQMCSTSELLPQSLHLRAAVRYRTTCRQRKVLTSSQHRLGEWEWKNRIMRIFFASSPAVLYMHDIIVSYKVSYTITAPPAGCDGWPALPPLESASSADSAHPPDLGQNCLRQSAVSSPCVQCHVTVASQCLLICECLRLPDPNLLFVHVSIELLQF